MNKINATIKISMEEKVSEWLLEMRNRAEVIKKRTIFLEQFLKYFEFIDCWKRSTGKLYFRNGGELERV